MVNISEVGTEAKSTITVHGYSFTFTAVNTFMVTHSRLL